MFVGLSEISITLTVKHEDNVVITRAFNFSMPERTEKIAGLRFTRKVSTQTDTMVNKRL